MSLLRLAVGEKARIVCFNADEKSLVRFMEMGLRVNDQIRLLCRLPFGGNFVILSNYGKYILREQMAGLIHIDKSEDEQNP